MLRLHEREALRDIYRAWAKKNRLNKGETTFVLYLCSRGLINEEEARHHIERGGK